MDELYAIDLKLKKKKRMWREVISAIPVEIMAKRGTRQVTNTLIDHFQTNVLKASWNICCLVKVSPFSDYKSYEDIRNDICQHLSLACKLHAKQKIRLSCFALSPVLKTWKELKIYLLNTWINEWIICDCSCCPNLGAKLSAAEIKTHLCRTKELVGQLQKKTF